MVTWPSGKARVCKTLIHQFKSGRHLQKIPGNFGSRDFLFLRLFPISLLALSVTYGDIFPRSGGSLSSKGEPLAKSVTLQLSRKVCRSAALSQKAALQMPFTFTPPSSENTMPERPQTLRHCSLKNYSSSEHGRSKAEAIPDRSPQNFSRIWYHTTPPWVEPETPSFTKPNFA